VAASVDLLCDVSESSAWTVMRRCVAALELSAFNATSLDSRLTCKHVLRYRAGAKGAVSDESCCVCWAADVLPVGGARPTLGRYLCIRIVPVPEESPD
jgi:hypothetical protein